MAEKKAKHTSKSSARGRQISKTQSSNLLETERNITVDFLTLFEMQLERKTVPAPGDEEVEYNFNTRVNIHKSIREDRTVGSTTFNISSHIGDEVVTMFVATYIWGFNIDGVAGTREEQQHRAVDFSRLVIWQRCRALFEQVVTQSDLDFPRPPMEAMGIDFAGFFDDQSETERE